MKTLSIAKVLLLVVMGATVACAGGADEETSAVAGAAADSLGSNVHTPAVGSPERAAFFDGVRREFDRQVQSHAAPGTKDVEFDVSGDGILRLATRGGAMWGFVAARAVKPGTREPFDYSQAPRPIELGAQDDEGKVDNRIIAILKETDGVWNVISPRGFPELYFAPTDVNWSDLPCTAGVAFGILEGGAASPAECGQAPAKDCRDQLDVLEKVPADQLGIIVKEYADDGAKKVTTKPDGHGTFTVEGLFSVCK